MTSVETEVRFDFHGLGITIRGDWPEVIEPLRLDFLWFERRNGAGPSTAAEVVIEKRRPDWTEFAALRADYVTPRNVVYRDGHRTVVDHLGRALSVVDPQARRLLVQGEDAMIVHDAVYYAILADAGAHLDHHGRARVHGVGLVGGQGAVVILLPSGGGKSTLALRALRQDGVRLLSDESPVLDRRGRVHPFPLRIGVNPEDAASLPNGRGRLIERLVQHPKLGLDADVFADSIENTPQPLRHIVLAQRSLSAFGLLEPVARHTAIGPLLRDSVVGLGLHQGYGSVLDRGLVASRSKVVPVVARSACCATAVRRAQVWRLTMGRDRERNWEALLPLLQ
jgi:hypothetical protein